MARKTRKKPLMNQTPELLSATSAYRAGLYLRLSVESHEDMESNSLGHQREICLDYLKDKPDVQVCETYIDNGFSGTNFERDEFQRMIADLQTGTINCVVVKDLSRFGRNYLDVDEYLNDKFPAWGVRFISVLERFDTSVPDKDGFLIIPFRNILNDYYARDFSQKVRSAIHAKMECGEYLGNAFNTPYGYLRDGENHTYQINPETAPTLQRIFQLRAQGNSMNHIATLLNQDGIPSPTKYLYLKGAAHAKRYADVVWTYHTVRQILKNEVYLGCRVHRKVESELRGTCRRFTSKEEQIRIENAHEPLISPELFEQVQKINQERTRDFKQMKPQPKPDCDFRDGLKGKVYCGDCGRAIRFAISKFGKEQTTLYTRCSSYLKYSALCTRHSIPMIRLAEIIRRELEHQVDLVQTTEKLLQQLSVSDDGKIAALKRQLQSVKVRRQHMDGRKSQLLVDYMDKVLEKDEFLYIKDKYDAEVAALTEEEAAIQSQLAEFAQLRRSAEQWAAAMRGYQRDRQLSDGLLREVVERIDLYEREREMSVHLTFRYQDIFQKVMTYMGGVADGTAQTKL